MTGKCNKLSVLTHATDGLISVLNKVPRASFITAGQSTVKASYWLFRSVISHVIKSMTGQRNSMLLGTYGRSHHLSTQSDQHLRFSLLAVIFSN